MGYDYRWVTRPTEVREELKRASERYRAALAYRDTIPEEEHGRWNPAGPEEFIDGSQRWKDAANEVMRLSDEVDRANISYFRLNIFGGGRYCRAMEGLGMVRVCAEPGSGDWPKLAGSDDEDPERVSVWEVAEMVAEHLGGDADTVPEEEPADLPDYYKDHWWWLTEHPEFLAQLREYNTLRTELLTRAPDSGSMWAHKIAGSNDGWINTPDEIRSALKIYHEHDTEDVHVALAREGITDLDYWGRWIEFLGNSAELGDGFKTH